MVSNRPRDMRIGRPHRVPGMHGREDGHFYIDPKGFLEVYGFSRDQAEQCMTTVKITRQMMERALQLLDQQQHSESENQK